MVVASFSAPALSITACPWCIINSLSPDVYKRQTVGCVNSIAKALETAAKKFVGGNVEDIIAFQHPYGCSQMGDVYKRQGYGCVLNGSAVMWHHT